jgi:GMP synthase PP-ATPase subunit
MKQNNKRKIINKHIGNNFNANSLAYKAIQIQGSITKDSITYSYNKDTNILTVNDGIFINRYIPLITSDIIEPFNELIREEF